MKMKKIVAAALISCLALVTLAGCGGSKDDAKTENKDAGEKTIIVGTNPAFAPFEFQDEQGNMKGFDLDLMKAIGEDQGFKVEFKNMEFDSLVGALQTGDINAVAAGMSITPERLKAVAFSNPYMDASVGIAVPADNKDIKDENDLKGKVVCSQIGTVGAEICETLKKEGKVKDVKVLSDFNLCMQELKTGGSDACIYDIPVIKLYQSKHEGEIKLLDKQFTSDYYAIAVAKDDKELLEKINTGLKDIIANGKYEELCKKYELPVSETITKGQITVDKAAELKKAEEAKAK